jgi:hypothetical protein
LTDKRLCPSHRYTKIHFYVTTDGTSHTGKIDARLNTDAIVDGEPKADFDGKHGQHGRDISCCLPAAIGINENGIGRITHASFAPDASSLQWFKMFLVHDAEWPTPTTASDLSILTKQRRMMQDSGLGAVQVMTVYFRHVRDIIRDGIQHMAELNMATMTTRLVAAVPCLWTEGCETANDKSFRRFRPDPTSPRSRDWMDQ